MTEESFQQSNIYCEVPYCAPDSRYFVYERTNPAHEGDRCEFVVCESKTSFSQAQNTQAHPYLTPDLKWAIFNSDRSGEPHIHAATVPEGMIAALGRG